MLTNPTFSRADLRERIGIDDDALEHMLRRQIVRPMDATQGRGNRRKFGVEDVMIAAIMTEFHGYGVGLPVMTRLSDMLYAAVDVGRGLDIRPSEFPAARAITNRLVEKLGAAAGTEGKSGHDSDRSSPPRATPPASRTIMPPAERLVIAIDSLSSEGVIHLVHYLDLVDPAHLEETPESQLFWDLVPVGDDFELQMRHGVGMPALMDRDDRISCITVSIDRLARKIWLPPD